MIKINIGKNEQNQRLDKFLRKYLENAPLSFIYKTIRKDVKINGKRGREDTVLQLDDELTLYISDDDLRKFKRKERQVRAKRQFRIAYEDDNIIVVEKPFGLLTHGDHTEKKNHLTNQVVDYLIEKGDYNPRVERTFAPAPVNRLDRNTTGLVLFAKNYMALQELNRLMREKNRIRKYYMTIVSGNLKEKLVLRDRMVKDSKNNKVTVVSEDKEGLLMETIVTPVKSNDRYTLVQVEIITGRTHQIRAHLAKAGHPVIGDVKYGDRRVNSFVNKKFGLSTQLLHAYRLEFDLEGSELEYLTGKSVEAQLPYEFMKIQNELLGR